MSPDHVEIVRGIFQAWAKGDFQYGAELFDDQIAYVVRQEFPESGAFLGLEQVGAYMRLFLEQWERVTFDAEDLKAIGDTVVARVLQHGKGSASGVEGENRFFLLFTFRGRRIVRMEAILGEDDALEAVGLSEGF